MASELASAVIAKGDLRSQGFRYIKRGTEYRWVHPLDVQFTDIDCTDLDDDDFARVVGVIVPNEEANHG